MINAPDSPTVGQVFTSAGASWQWDGTKWVAVSGNPGYAPVGAVNNVGRNLIHNSLFNICQRTGPWTTSASYTADRWQLLLSGDAASVSRLVASDGMRSVVGDEVFQYYLSNAFTGSATATAFNEVVHKVEGVRRLAGKTVTLSFWAWSSVGTLSLGLSGYNNYGSGGSPSGPDGFAIPAVALTTSITRFSRTFTVPSSAGKTLGTAGDDSTNLQFWFSSAANNAAQAGIGVQSGTINLWGVQLEIGSTATPLEKPDPQQDLAKCQRFYQLVNVTVRTLVTQGWYYDFPVTFPAMRVTPTAAVVTAGTLVNVTSQNMYPANNISVRYEINSTASGDTAVYNSSWSLSADL